MSTTQTLAAPPGTGPAGSRRRRVLDAIGSPAGDGRARRFWSAAAPPLVVLVVLAVGWDVLAVRSGNFATPSVEEVLAAVPRVFGSAEAWRALAVSDLSLLLGYSIALLIGVPVGFLMARNPRLDRVLVPYLEIAVVVPMAVMMPVVLIALGLNRTAQVVVIILFALPFITAATRGGARTLPRLWTEMSLVFGAREAQVWRHVLLPGSIGTVVAGLRLGFAQALTGLVTVELTLIALGIGRQLITYQSHFQSAELFAFVGMLMAQSVVVMSALSLLETRVAKR